MGVNYRRDSVIYQIYPRSFMDSDGDGVGDIRGIISKLDHIAALGADNIWLSPVYVSPNDDNGYDIADYKAIQPQFGTMEDFDELLSEAKKRGIGIVMDLVINHTSDEHEWFKKALAGDKKYRDYYIIRKGKKNKVPNNWGNFFAECPWTRFGDSEDEYYLHLFSKKQPDLNWHNPEVKEEVKDIMRFWLDKGVAGFRCDVINVIWKDTLRNGKKRIALTGQEHYLSTKGCHDILAELRREVLEPYGAFAIGETVFVDIPKAKDLCDEERGELDMVFSFQHMDCDNRGLKWFPTKMNLKKLMNTLTQWQTGLDWNTVYFENHDQPRFISRFNDSEAFRKECSKMMAGLIMTLRGTPFVYEGQEIGMTNGDFSSLDEIMDIESHNINALAKKLGIPKGMRWKMLLHGTRDHARTPVQWSGEENAGFTKGTPWLQINGNYKEVNAECDKADEKGVFAFWQKMISLRKTNEILCDGSFVPVYQDGKIYAFRREKDGKALLSVFNMTGKKVKLPKELYAKGETLAANYEDRNDKFLSPFEFRLTAL